MYGELSTVHYVSAVVRPRTTVSAKPAADKLSVNTTNTANPAVNRLATHLPRRNRVMGSRMNRYYSTVRPVVQLAPRIVGQRSEAFGLHHQTAIWLLRAMARRRRRRQNVVE